MDKNQTKTVPASHWGENITHYALLVKPMYKDGKIVGFSNKQWFKKTECELVRVPAEENTDNFPGLYKLTAPVWLLDKNGVEYDG